jgi:germacradienol/geosmin synthase
MPGPARRALRRAITDMTASWIWELANQAHNRIPDPVDYIEMRRKTFGSDLTMSLSRLACAVRPALYRSGPVVAMENAAADYACLLNDVFSYVKEIQFEGEIHNCVLVVQNFLDCGAAQAVRVVGDLMTARMRQFQHAVAVEIPALLTARNLNAAAGEALYGHTGRPRGPHPPRHTGRPRDPHRARHLRGPATCPFGARGTQPTLDGARGRHAPMSRLGCLGLVVHDPQ